MIGVLIQTAALAIIFRKEVFQLIDYIKERKSSSMKEGQ